MSEIVNEFGDLMSNNIRSPIWVCSSTAEQGAHNALVVGAAPTRPTMKEDVTLNDLLKAIANNDVLAVRALLDYLIDNYPLSFAINKIRRYLETWGSAKPNRDLGDFPENLCYNVLAYGMNSCPKCGSQRTSVHNHSLMWGDGDIICDDCGAYVRMFDSG